MALVFINDVAALRYHYGHSLGDALYDPWFDMDGDGAIFLVDVALLRVGFGASCYPA